MTPWPKCTECDDCGPSCGCDCHRPARLPKAMAILAPTAAALLAACAGGGAEVAEPATTQPTPTTAPSTTEPTMTTEATPTTEATVTTATTAPAERAPIVVTATTIVPVPVETDGEWVDRQRLLNCIRSYEQGADGYATETGNGYHGGYQFDQPTWDGVVGRAGHPEWVGRRAGDAPAYVQDDAAWLLYLDRGLQPWPTPQVFC